MRTPALLAILDGVGLAAPGTTNAVSSANAPFLHELFSDTRYPCRSLSASGRDVGLPEGQMGNSEVGHLNIGSGRIINQELTRIDCAIENRSIFENEVLKSAFTNTIPDYPPKSELDSNDMLPLHEDERGSQDSPRTVHFMGLLSDGGVHSHVTHLYVLMIMAAKLGVKRIRVHAFLDGRDVSPTSGRHFITGLDDLCQQLNAEYPGLDARIGVISGRYYAMDRDNRWERVQKAWQALVGEQAEKTSVGLREKDCHSALDAESSDRSAGSLRVSHDDLQVNASQNSLFTQASSFPSNPRPTAATPAQLVQQSYDAGITDEFFEPINVAGDTIHDGDSVVFFNFRPDRARELTRAFIDPDFDGFERPFVPEVTYVCMTEYDATFERDFNTRVAFPKSFPKNVLADYLSDLGLRQLHIAETEKYAHVTFFLNGGVEEPKAGEQRILIPSPKVATYDLQPEMSAPGVTDALVEAIESDAADVYIVNYANGDMVGHTGVLPATIAAIEAVDAGLKQVVDAIREKGGVALVTADHGNSEQMIAEDGTAWTAHTLAPVPLALIEAGEKSVDLEREHPARLADIAPTLLDLMELPIPEEWTGRSLLVRS